MAVIFAVLGTEMAIVITYSSEVLWVNQILLISIMAFPLFVSAVLFAEERGWSKRIKALVHGIIIVFLLAYYFFIMPDNIMTAPTIFITRYIFWTVAFYLLILCARFLRKQDNSINAFWQFNKILFFSLALTGIYVGVLQAGLSVALASIDYLFELQIDERIYLHIWAILEGTFGSLFFLSRLPKKYEEYASKTDYPKELKLFAQFVLVPLVSLYFIILYAYVIRVLVSWEWPKGILAYMILGFSLLGVFTYAVLYPLREKFGWVKRAGQVYYIILIPQIGMLFWSLWWRISQYGVTEKRYLVLIFGCWLLALALYLLISKRKDIKLIPLSLIIIAILISFGPWGAFEVSKKSQINRLEGLLVKNKLLVNGEIEELTDIQEFPFEDNKEIVGITRYLYQNHGLEIVEDVLNKDLDYIEKEAMNAVKGFRPSAVVARRIVTEVLKLNYVAPWETEDYKNNYFNFKADVAFADNSVVEIGDYEYLIYIESACFRDLGRFSESEYQYNLDNNESRFKINRDGLEVVNYDLAELIDSLGEKYSMQPTTNLNSDEMSFSGENDVLAYKFYIATLGGTIESDSKYHTNNLKGWLFFTLK